MNMHRLLIIFMLATAVTIYAQEGAYTSVEQWENAESSPLEKAHKKLKGIAKSQKEHEQSMNLQRIKMALGGCGVIIGVGTIIELKKYGAHLPEAPCIAVASLLFTLLSVGLVAQSYDQLCYYHHLHTRNQWYHSQAQEDYNALKRTEARRNARALMIRNAYTM